MISKKILVLNCGSSSLKYKIISMPSEEVILFGEAQRVGNRSQEASTIIHTVMGNTRIVEVSMPDHGVALKKVLELIAEDAGEDKTIGFDLFAHRYVNPGSIFNKPQKIDADTLKKLGETLPFAPLHNPIIYNLVKFCHNEFPKIEQIVVFDTSFHKTIPPEFSTYALSRKITKKYNIRKIGFHGLSHQYVMEEACRILDVKQSSQKIISCHLGTGGSSICAIENGKSINNSMGFTPLEGLMMNTRCGDVDTGLLFYLMFKEQFSSEETEAILNKKSGILGVFNDSSDLRDVIRHVSSNVKAKMAFNMYVRRVRAYIGFYSLILKKANIVIFTDSLGCESAPLREAICADMGCLGVAIDRTKNADYRQGIGMISSDKSDAKILIIPTDEEKMIVRKAYKEMRK